MSDRAPELYSEAFFSAIRDGSRRSAERVVPILLRLVEPTSVVDVGCGTGEWLQEFARHGVKQLVGVDGEHLRHRGVELGEIWFIPMNLEERIELRETFGLAMCLEVAEHLPEFRAESLVDDLCRMAPVVAFAAAIPRQGGTGHVNERWPSFWASLFKKRGWEPLDVLRPILWMDPDVEEWYAQNLILFAERGSAAAVAVADRVHSSLGREGWPLDVVHPRVFDRVVGQALSAADPERFGIRRLASALARALLRKGRDLLRTGGRVEARDGART